jgi:hypothetical protein
MKRVWCWVAMVAMLGCLGCGGQNIRPCWNEREGDTWSTNGKVIRTCCQDALSGAFMESNTITGPVTCTATIQEGAR